MAMTIGGKTPQSIEIGGKAVQSLAIGGEVVWSAASPPDYFWVENAYNGLNTVTLKKTGAPSTGTTLEWSGDLSTWHTVTYDANNEFLIGIPNQNQKIYFRSSDGFSKFSSSYFTFSATNSLKAGGDLITLIDYTDQSSAEVELSSYSFYKMFEGSGSAITDVTAIDFSRVKPAGGSCCAYMFSGCTAITETPVLTPARPNVLGSYNCMFYGCSSLNKVISYAASLGPMSSQDWLYGVAARGSFYNFSGATIETSTSGIPSGWTEHTTL